MDDTDDFPLAWRIGFVEHTFGQPPSSKKAWKEHSCLTCLSMSGRTLV
jgi:hypothetical protein